MEYYQFQFGAIPRDIQDALLAYLPEQGFTGFEETEEGWSAFIPVDIFSEEEFTLIVEKFPVTYSKTIIQEENWNAQWESGFEPVMIPNPMSGDPWIMIRAGFHAPNPEIPIELEVTPKMSFGTGHHATTFLVMQQMGRMDFTDQTVIDFGSGTAVLAILAEKLGARDILAIDYDQWCINNAEENLSANHCAHIRLKKADSLNNADDKASVILANINLNIILDNLAGIKKALLPGGRVVFSGLLDTDEAAFRVHLGAAGFAVESVFHREKWIAVVASLMQ